MTDRLLEVKDLKTHFQLEDKTIYAVNGVSFSIGKREVVALIGESGSGKSVTALSIMGLIPSPPGEIKGGQILFNGENILDKSEKEKRKIRGNEISMVYQEPMNSLNPMLKVGYQIRECLTIHRKISKKEAKNKAIDILKKVEIPEPHERYNCYPFELSGGMRQRIMIAMALVCNPKLLIADEPTTALDVTIQAEILDLIRRLKDEYETSVLLITHDLGVVTEMSDKIVVMYSGKIMEIAGTRDLYNNAMHPYTKGLMKCIPRLNDKKGKLYTIKGTVPDMSMEVKGCEFYSRCDKRMDRCKEVKPKLTEIDTGHLVRCFHYGEVE
ncbi:ABC transporter ATP-binding protein [Dethiothermospora halolimnae]|uniref:ABC transporter ATP-binding protein n=1 Tax=Dethiothermospora halolimnae TaxID=3114390 RepID=UPI003CCC1EAA